MTKHGGSGGSMSQATRKRRRYGDRHRHLCSRSVRMKTMRFVVFLQSELQHGVFFSLQNTVGDRFLSGQTVMERVLLNDLLCSSTEKLRT